MFKPKTQLCFDCISCCVRFCSISTAASNVRLSKLSLKDIRGRTEARKPRPAGPSDCTGKGSLGSQPCIKLPLSGEFGAAQDSAPKFGSTPSACIDWIRTQGLQAKRWRAKHVRFIGMLDRGALCREVLRLKPHCLAGGRARRPACSERERPATHSHSGLPPTWGCVECRVDVFGARRDHPSNRAKDTCVAAEYPNLAHLCSVGRGG